MQATEVDSLVNRIAVMDRQTLLCTLKGMECDFKIDFTDDFLNSISLERLKHIVLAASLHAHSGRPAM